MLQIIQITSFSNLLPSLQLDITDDIPSLYVSSAQPNRQLRLLISHLSSWDRHICVKGAIFPADSLSVMISKLTAAMLHPYCTRRGATFIFHLWNQLGWCLVPC